MSPTGYGTCRVGSAHGLVGLGGGVPGDLAYARESWGAGGLSSLDTSQAQNQGFELAHPNDELLECTKGAGPTDPKLQHFHDIRQQQDI